MAPKRAAKTGNDREGRLAKSQKKEANGEAKIGKGDGGDKTDEKGEKKGVTARESSGIITAEKIAESLLAKEIVEMAYPDVPQGHGEVDWPASERRKVPPKPQQPRNQNSKSKGGTEKKGPLRMYTSPDLSPFEQLVCAVLLSKPISHTLGLRAIRTLLSPPFSFTTPKAMEEAGNERRREALWEARTQHKEKTAAQLGDLVEGIRKLGGDDQTEEDQSQLSAIRREAENAGSHSAAVDKVRDVMTKNIKGIGPTGVDIFLRQVQRQTGWDAIFPFVDARVLSLAASFGLVSAEEAKSTETGAEALAKIVKKDKVRFVKLLDVLIGLDLEKKTDEMIKKVGKATTTA